MEFTNKSNYPRGVRNFLEYNDYSPGKRTDISVTKLIGSPLVASLWKAHGRDVVEDCADRLWSGVGSSVHQRFEEANASDSSMVMEKRFYADIPYQDRTITLSGQIDAYDFDERCLADVKTSGVYKVVIGEHDDWIAQLNINRWLMMSAGFQVDKLEIWSIARDWSRARTREKDYPKHPISILEMPVWSLEDTYQEILNRLELHFGDAPKVCTDKDRWARPRKFAVMKKGRKSALRLLPTKAKAESWIKTQAAKESGISIVERPAEYIRCESFCAFKPMGVCPNYL